MVPIIGKASAIREVQLHNDIAQKDLRERDELSARIADRESKRRRKMQEGSSSVISRDDILSLTESGSVGHNDNNGSAIAKLRELYRQQYLEKRELKELTLLEKSLRDEEELFGSRRRNCSYGPWGRIFLVWPMISTDSAIRIIITIFLPLKMVMTIVAYQRNGKLC